MPIDGPTPAISGTNEEASVLQLLVPRLRLLLIEDDDLLAELTRAILTARGFDDTRMVVAGSIAEAALVLQSREIDLILADLALPDGDGLEVVRRCRELAPDLPIIVLTACRNVAMALEALEKGAQDYLIKGEFDDDTLMRSIRYSLARCHAEGELRVTLHSLEVANRHLQASNIQLEQYASIASHDLRAPVRTARVLVGRMIASPALRAEPKVVELGSLLDASLGRLEAMLEGLLDYAQAGDLSSSGEFRDETVLSLVEEIRMDLDADLRESGAQVQLEMGGDISLRGHPALMRSLLHNVIGNAVKYRSGRPLRVAISVEEACDGRVLVRVTDNGVGIEPRFRIRVFEMFERLSSRSEGVGLGLSLCHRIVSLHGGGIWIEDGPDGDGIAVCFTVPATP